MGRANAIMIAATKQHTGKSTVCLALVAGLLAEKRVGRVGYMKPVGQRHASVRLGDRTYRVDTDCLLIKETFNLETCDYNLMSPVLVPRGYSKSFIDGEITEAQQVSSIRRAFRRISEANDFMVVEGTGHVGVGSIIQMNNARVASLLDLDMVLVVNGGIGSAFDELALNRQLCLDQGVHIRGVLVNKVMPDKVETVRDYFGRALKRWDVPLIGIVPDVPQLSRPCAADCEFLFDTTMLNAPDLCDRLSHFNKTSLVDMGKDIFKQRLVEEDHSSTLFMTHVSRDDIVMEFLAHAEEESEWKAGLILAGREAPSAGTLAAVKRQARPVLHAAGFTTFEAMLMIENHMPKLQAEDRSRVSRAVEHYVAHIDFPLVLGSGLSTQSGLFNYHLELLQDPDRILE